MAMKQKKIVLCAVASATALALNAWDAASFPVASSEATFALDTMDEIAYPIVLSSQAEISSMRQVAYRANEAVTATAPNNTESSLVAGETAAGTAVFAPSCGGFWTLANTSGETAKFLVKWSAYGEDAGTAIVTSDDLGGTVIDTRQPGPDRKLKKREAPPVAYSGDDWKGDLSKASTVTFTPPEGSGLEATTWNRTGTGAESFTFNAKGVWTVTLTFAGNTPSPRTAHIDIQTAGFVFIVK